MTTVTTARTLTTIVDSPVGPLRLSGRDDGTLTGLQLLGDTAPPSAPGAHAEPVFTEAAAQLAAYFAGELTAFDLPLALTGTDFQLRVWQQLQAIPYAEVRSYGQVAAAAGNPQACRAVGMANNRNPIAIIVPCHRVVGADGSLTGYGGGLDRKQYLLELERRVSTSARTG